MEEIEKEELHEEYDLGGPYYQASYYTLNHQSPRSVIASTTWRNPGYSYRGLLIVNTILMALLGAIVFTWQICVLTGHATKYPDGTFDDWHEQKILFGESL